MKKRSEISFWRMMTNFWTFVFFALIIYDFILDNALDHNNVILIVSVLYGATLAIYSAEKEFKRWHDRFETMHPGELYVIVWTVIIFGIIVLNLYLNKPYELPAEVRASYVVVVGILALTRESRYLYKKLHKRK